MGSFGHHGLCIRNFRDAIQASFYGAHAIKFIATISFLAKDFVIHV